MQKSIFFLFLTVIAFNFTSCQEDEVGSDIGSGRVISVNEGNFGAGNGSISLYDPDNETVENNVFDKVNSKLSASIQSVSIYQDKTFIICNAADKIEIVDSETFDRVAAPLAGDSLITPRYMTTAGNKAYVTVWGPYGEDYSLNDSKVAVLNLTDYSIIKMIDTNPGPEDILAVDDKVFVANSFTNTLTVINTQTDAVDTILTINAGPTQLELDQNNMIWISTKGGFEGTAQFISIDPENYAIGNEVDAGESGVTGKFTMNADRDSVFFLGAAPYPSTESAVYTFSTTSPVTPASALINGNSFYGIGIDPNSNILYIGDANAFQGEGTVLRYHTNGELIDDFPVGIAPNSFVFQ